MNIGDLKPSADWSKVEGGEYGNNWILHGKDGTVIASISGRRSWTEGPGGGKVLVQRHLTADNPRGIWTEYAPDDDTAKLLCEAALDIGTKLLGEDQFTRWCGALPPHRRSEALLRRMRAEETSKLKRSWGQLGNDPSRTCWNCGEWTTACGCAVGQGMRG